MAVMAACSELPSSCLRWLVGEMHVVGGDLSDVPFRDEKEVVVVRQRPSGFVKEEMVKKCKARRRGAGGGAGSGKPGGGGGWRVAG